MRNIAPERLDQLKSVNDSNALVPNKQMKNYYDFSSLLFYYQETKSMCGCVINNLPPLWYTRYGGTTANMSTCCIQESATSP